MNRPPEICLVCNGVGGHADGCRGTSAYDELRAATIVLLQVVQGQRCECHRCDHDGCNTCGCLDEAINSVERAIQRGRRDDV